MPFGTIAKHRRVSSLPDNSVVSSPIGSKCRAIVTATRRFAPLPTDEQGESSRLARLSSLPRCDEYALCSHARRSLYGSARCHTLYPSRDSVACPHSVSGVRLQWHPMFLPEADGRLCSLLRCSKQLGSLRPRQAGFV